VFQYIPVTVTLTTDTIVKIVEMVDGPIKRLVVLARYFIHIT